MKQNFEIKRNKILNYKRQESICYKRFSKTYVIQLEINCSRVDPFKYNSYEIKLITECQY